MEDALRSYFSNPFSSTFALILTIVVVAFNWDRIFAFDAGLTLKNIATFIAILALIISSIMNVFNVYKFISKSFKNKVA